MPAPSTTAELLELVRKSELIPPARLEAFLQQAHAAAPDTPPKEMVRLLVAAGLLTNFQAEQFLQGKWRGFTIGKYKVLERLGSGGMGNVYLCEHLMVGRRVAIKVLPTSQSDNPSALGRFYREARAAGVLDHPNLVKAHDIDQEGGLHFLVMDYVDGANLQDVVARAGPLSVERACHYIRQAAQGLAAAHSAGLVHRDIKPANLLLERDGTVRVLDLGLARFYHDDTDPLTLKYDDKNVLGTADYVAPEQALNSHEVDIRADIYSLGCTFYFLLTGQPPFPQGKVAQKLIWHQVKQPPPVGQFRSDVPSGVLDVLQRMTAKNPAQRYQTPAEVVEALADWTESPLPPPAEEEMPRLSPAVVPSVPSASGGPQTPRRALRPAAVGAPVALPASGMPAVAVDPVPHSASAAELGTPRLLAAHAATETDRPRDARSLPRPELVSPSKVLAQQEEATATATASAPGPGGLRRTILFLAVVGIGAVTGLAMRFLLAAWR